MRPSALSSQKLLSSEVGKRPCATTVSPVVTQGPYVTRIARRVTSKTPRVHQDDVDDEHRDGDGNLADDHAVLVLEDAEDRRGHDVELAAMGVISVPQ